MKPVSVPITGSVPPPGVASRESFASRFEALKESARGMVLNSRAQIRALTVRFNELMDSFRIPKMFRPRLWKFFALGLAAAACGGSGPDSRLRGNDMGRGDMGDTETDMQPRGSDAETPDGGTDAGDAGTSPFSCDNAEGLYFDTALISPSDPDTHVTVPANRDFPEYAGYDLLVPSGTFSEPVCIELNAATSKGPAPGGTRWVAASGIEASAVPMANPVTSEGQENRAEPLPGHSVTVSIPGRRDRVWTNTSDGSLEEVPTEFTDTATLASTERLGPFLPSDSPPSIPEAPDVTANPDGSATITLGAEDEGSDTLHMLALTLSLPDGTPVPMAERTETSARFSVPAGILAPGTHSLTASLTDTNGNTVTRPVTVNVPDLSPPPAPDVSPLAGIVAPPGTVTVGPSYVPAGVPVRVSVPPGTDPATIIGMRIREAPGAVPRPLAYTPGSPSTDTSVPDPSSCEFQLIKTGGIEGSWGSVLNVLLDDVPPGAALFDPPGPRTVGPGGALVSETVTMPATADLASATLRRSDGVTTPLDATPGAAIPLSLDPGFTYSIETVDATGENRSESAPLEIDVDSVAPGAAVFSESGPVTVGLAEASTPYPETVTLPADLDLASASLADLTTGEVTPLEGAAPGATLPLELLPGHSYEVRLTDGVGNTSVFAPPPVLVDSLVPATPILADGQAHLDLPITATSAAFDLTLSPDTVRLIVTHNGALVDAIEITPGTTSYRYEYTPDTSAGETLGGPFTFDAEGAHNPDAGSAMGEVQVWEAPTLGTIEIDTSLDGGIIDAGVDDTVSITVVSATTFTVRIEQLSGFDEPRAVPGTPDPASGAVGADGVIRFIYHTGNQYGMRVRMTVTATNPAGETGTTVREFTIGARP